MSPVLEKELGAVRDIRLRHLHLLLPTLAEKKLRDNQDLHRLLNDEQNIESTDLIFNLLLRCFGNLRGDELKKRVVR